MCNFCLQKLTLTVVTQILFLRYVENHQEEENPEGTARSMTIQTSKLTLKILQTALSSERHLLEKEETQGDRHNLQLAEREGALGRGEGESANYIIR
jgi:hypothetical protein